MLFAVKAQLLPHIYKQPIT